MTPGAWLDKLRMVNAEIVDVGIKKSRIGRNRVLITIECDYVDEHAATREKFKALPPAPPPMLPEPYPTLPVGATTAPTLPPRDGTKRPVVDAEFEDDE